MRKIVKAYIIILVFTIQFAVISTTATAARVAPSRIINVVYDDSGSMYTDNNMMWSQAKYAAEVFAAMLGPDDNLNIYLMSDFLSIPSIETPRLQLSGRNGTDDNVKAVHDMVTSRASNTPFGVVELAYNDLVGMVADEKWLVILTDGDFNGMSKMQENAFLSAKSSDVQVYYLAMGSDVTSGIISDDNKCIYYAHAISGNDVLEKVTDMCTRLFNFNKLKVDPSTRHIGFDVPMKELTVFAQGQSVNIAGIINASGTLIKGNAPVHVTYCDQPATDYPDAPYDTSLNGYLATFSGEYPAGNYTLSVSGANTVEVYYKPDVEIDVFLTDDRGQEVTTEKLIEGEYSLNFCFVKSGTKTRLNRSELLGDITYSVIITSDGIKENSVYTHGDRVFFSEGNHRIDATAVYLDYYSVQTDRIMTIFKDKDISLWNEILPETIYRLTEYGFDRDDPFVAMIQIDGRDFTSDEWAKLGVPQVLGANDMLSFRAEKGDIGKIKIYPIFEGFTSEDAEKVMGLHSVQVLINETRRGDESWNGSLDLSFKIDSGYRDISYYLIGDAPQYEIDKNGILNANEPILIEALLEGRKIEISEWVEMLELPSAKAVSGNVGGFLVEKTDVAGQYVLYPTLYQGSLSKTEAANSEIEFSYAERVGNEVWVGNGKGDGGLMLTMTDSRSWIGKNLENIVRLAIILLIIIFLLGYVPPFKKYLPKRLVKRPAIECSPNRPGIKAVSTKGKFNKFKLSTITPYRAERGTIKYAPPGVSAPILKVRGAGSNGMLITNVRDFGGKDHITFDGVPVDKEKTKPMRIGPGTVIAVITKDVTYTCSPSNK